MEKKDEIRAVPSGRGKVNGSQDNKKTNENVKEAEKAFTDAKKQQGAGDK